MISSLYKHFQPWSNGGSIYIFSDTHFEDNDCKIMNPNWINPQEQVDIINKIVHPSDTFILLGDVGNPEWINKIKSKNKILIMGNHDQGVSIYEKYFNEVFTGPLFISDKILLSHEPLHISCALNIHGHCHNGAAEPIYYPEGGITFNVAADVVNYTPINLNDIIKKGLLKKVTSIHRQTIDHQTKNSLLRKEEKKKMEEEIEIDDTIPNCDDCEESIYIGHGLYTCGRFCEECPYIKNGE